MNELLSFRLFVIAIVLLAPASAFAANPTFYQNRPQFLAALKVGQTDTDDYSNPAYQFIQSDAVMTGVHKQTIYNSTGFNNLNIVENNGQPGAKYCSGCNGSFRLTFTATTVGTVNGVFGVGVDIQANDMNLPYFAYITFGDASTKNVPLPPGPSFFAVSAPELVKSIHFGLSGGMTTQSGYFEIDNLTIGAAAMPPPPCMTDADCDDKNPCNGTEICDPVQKFCTVPGPLDCDDKNVCTDDSCDPMVGCVHTPAAGVTMCDDNDTCTTNDQCNSGVCSGTPLDCNDNNDCTDDACDPMVGCTHNGHAGACDDGDACTMDDQCTNGSCTGTPLDCDDKNDCTDDACDPMAGCSHTPNSNPCDDKNACTMNDVCSNGSCAGVGITCDDKNACTTDSCDPMTGCKNAPIMGCMGCMVNGQLVDCDDKNVCTKDACGMSGCTHTKIDGCCHTDADCNQDEACDTMTNQCTQVAPDSGGTVTKAGCSCRAPGESPSSDGAWAGLATLAAAAVLRRRKRTV